MKPIARSALSASLLLAGLALAGCNRAADQEGTAARTDTTTTTTTTTDSTAPSASPMAASPGATVDTTTTTGTTSDTTAPATDTSTGTTPPAPATDVAPAPSAPAAAGAAAGAAATTPPKAKKKKTTKASPSEPAGLSDSAAAEIDTDSTDAVENESLSGTASDDDTDSGFAAGAAAGAAGGTAMTTEPGGSVEQTPDADIVDPTIDSTASGMTTSEPTDDVTSGTVSGSPTGTPDDMARGGGERDVSEDNMSEDNVSTRVTVKDRHDKEQKSSRMRDGQMERDKSISGTTQAAPEMRKEEMGQSDRFSDLDNPAKALEPQSRYPDKTGVTSITGEDRNHAQAGKVTVFTDPTVAPMRDRLFHRGQDTPVARVNLQQYPYEKRGNFRHDMEARLDNIDTRIEFLQTDLMERPKEIRDNYKAQVKQLETQHKAAEAHLNDANRIPNSQWNEYKDEFRDQVAELERSYDSLQTVMK